MPAMAPVATAPVETGSKKVSAPKDNEVTTEGCHDSSQDRALFRPRILRIVSITGLGVLYVLSLVSPTVRHLMSAFAAYLPK